MNVKILSVFATFLLLVILVPTAVAYDTNHPARFGVSYVVASDTAFLVMPHPTQSDDNRMDFVVTTPWPWPGGIATGIEPKDLPPGAYWARIQNVGTLPETYKISLNADNQPGVTLYADDDGAGPNPRQAVDTAGVTLPSWSGVPINDGINNGIVYLYVSADFDATKNINMQPGYTSTNSVFIKD